MVTSSLCSYCGKITPTMVVVACCKYIPNGLFAELPNHPSNEFGEIECTDECEPKEMDYSTFVKKVGSDQLPANKFLTCLLCHRAKQY